MLRTSTKNFILEFSVKIFVIKKYTIESNEIKEIVIFKKKFEIINLFSSIYLNIFIKINPNKANKDAKDKIMKQINIWPLKDRREIINEIKRNIMRFLFFIFLKKYDFKKNMLKLYNNKNEGIKDGSLNNALFPRDELINISWVIGLMLSCLAIMGLKTFGNKFWIRITTSKINSV